MAALDAVSQWNLEARDDPEHYFFQTRESDAIHDGRRIFVIGRKGTGKTAISEHIHLSREPNKFSILQSFKNFPFNEIYKFENPQFRKPNRYITVWKYVILCALCKLMQQNHNIDPVVRERLDRAINFDIEDAFEKKLRKITDRTFGFQILGTGASTEVGQPLDQDVPLFTRCDIIQEFVDQNIDTAKYFILFDELDEDYRDVLVDSINSSEYFDLISGLFKAAQEVHARFKANGKNVFPVVFLRDDIFDLLRDHDKPKWEDKAVNLNWDHSTLKEMVGYRISKADQPGAEGAGFPGAWSKIFSVRKTRLNSRRSTSVETFAYMLKSTYMRPRDVISYIRECAKVALSEGAARVDNAMIKKAEARHSNFMRSEIIAEMFSLVPEVSSVLDMLSEVRKPLLSNVEFDRNYLDLQVHLQGEASGLNSLKIKQLLYYFGAIGNVTSGNHQIYKYNSPRSKFNARENICIHRSLLKSLDIY